MRVIIQVSKKDRAKAWGILVRHSAGTALPDRIFIVSEDAVKALRAEGVKLKENGKLKENLTRTRANRPNTE